MTKAEKALMQKAVRLVWQQPEPGSFEEGMRILTKLCGMRIPALDIADGAAWVNVLDLNKEKDAERDAPD